EGLAVGVGFGAIGKTPSATFESARNLAIGIGIQNFPEGLAVSLPLRGAGVSAWTAFWYGQLSGMVEPLAGLLGAFAVVLAEPLLPYALAFAAGAMVYVVVDDIIPEAQVRYGRGTLGIDKEMKLLVWFGFSYTQEWKHKTSETRDFFDHLSLLHQWQWEVGLLDFHPGLRRDDVAGRGLGLTTHQHHESTSELFGFFFFVFFF
ncbi:unnamed protein product, partial [Tetraodon nigroviridis]